MQRDTDFELDDDEELKNLTDDDLVQEFYGYCVYRSSSLSFIVKRPDGKDKSCSKFLGYYTTLGGCVRAIIVCMRTDKLMNRSPYMKRNMESMFSVIEQQDKYIEEITAQFNEITTPLFKDPSEAQIEKNNNVKVKETKERKKKCTGGKNGVNKS
jgi:hypothetical protein